ncbi:hypothetical protein PDESU_01834 [Pontiella desulfatans]|uniref:Glycosyl hydrolases family 2 sugar binding domain-containing protein n=1 Tax=Pontiella desulfatans TaxID=2750659 RepID=A0A6C2TZY0_PONDE|nr:glycosyl hydrolase [Pontiella desulfatans]VGO13278.1 hypothetical protein PDESU_01834 [Pontiella desulfatans]
MFKALFYILALSVVSANAQTLSESFREPPDAMRPWVFWHWTNGNVTRDGITKDLEAMKDVGIGGVITFQLSGPKWAPPGPLKFDQQSQVPMIKWAAQEARRLGIDFSLVVDFGYGSGGPHITPDLSMQQLYRSEMPVNGGQRVNVKLPRPNLEATKKQELKKAWFRPGDGFNPKVLDALSETDSYRDIAIFAVPAENTANIKQLEQYDGMSWTPPKKPLDKKLTALAGDEIIDLTDNVNENGELEWDAPMGNWTVVRLGYGSTFKCTRPCPAPEVGLECDRLHPRGIDAHFDHRLKPVLDAAKADNLIDYIFIDSWEAHSQNWTKDFDEEFRKRRGYDLRPWLPVLAGRVVVDADQSERFLWDFRQTIGETMLVNYLDQLEERLKPYGTKLFFEPYGSMCADSLVWAGRGAFPVGEFWSNDKKVPEVPGQPAQLNENNWNLTMKGFSSIANTYGKPRVGAEAFTGQRGWSDHPYLIKGMGDHAFSEGVSHIIFHLSAHQPYDQMKPGITHRKWGQHFHRHQTWWDFSKPYMTYLARCQTLLQAGRRVADVAVLYNEGAPLYLRNTQFSLPPGYDFDLCTPEIIQRMSVEDGDLVLPTGVHYRYLEIQPEKLTLSTAKKIEALRQAGATIYTRSKVEGTPGLAGFPDSNIEVQRLAAQWPVLPKGDWSKVFASEQILPDFTGGSIRWLHRRTADADIYFVANTSYESIRKACLFRIAERVPELWNPETGERFKLPFERLADRRVRATIEFDPAQSWFVVFKDAVSAPEADPFPDYRTVQEIKGPWQLTFDPDWGTDKTIDLSSLESWTESEDPLVRYYSGTAVYRTSFQLDEESIGAASIDLGRVEVMARVILNGNDLGMVWKPPYRIKAADALKPGKNQLEIHVVNTWANRMIGDEQLPLDSEWKDWETLTGWPEWFLNGEERPSGRYTFTTARHYKKDSTLQPSGLLGPVRLVIE